MILTLMAKLLMWFWNFTPNEHITIGFIVIGCLETFIEVVAFFMWLQNK